MSLDILHTVVGGSVPSAFHANYLLSQKGITLLDQWKFQLLVPVSILGDVYLGQSTSGNLARRSGRFCSQKPVVWCVSILHTMYFYKVRYASFTLRFIFENLMFCIDMIWYLWIGYVIGIIHTVFTWLIINCYIWSYSVYSVVIDSSGLRCILVKRHEHKNERVNIK